jgi:hypothetical protein
LKSILDIHHASNIWLLNRIGCLEVPLNISSFDASFVFFFSIDAPRLEQRLVSCLSGGTEYVTKNVGDEVGFE